MQNNYLHSRWSKDNLLINKDSKSNSRSINLTKSKTDSDNFGENKSTLGQEMEFNERIPLNAIKWSENIIPRLDLQNAKAQMDNEENFINPQSKSSKRKVKNDENVCSFSTNDLEKHIQFKTNMAAINKFNTSQSIKSSPKTQSDFSNGCALKPKFQYNTLSSAPELKSSTKQEETVWNDEVVQSFNNSKESKIPFDISKTLNDFQLRSQNWSYRKFSSRAHKRNKETK